SDTAQVLLEWALANSLRPGADHVYLIATVEESLFDSLNLQVTLNSIMGEEQRIDKTSLIEARLHKMAEWLFAHHISAQVLVLSKSYKDALVQTTHDLRIDLLLVGSHETTAIERAIRSSLGEYCVAHCKCPVLVVKPSFARTHLPSSPQ
ncbi:adenine nucleotide alpha hydrolases-like protein, partial [Ramicandelaber brevisporus]